MQLLSDAMTFWYQIKHQNDQFAILGTTENENIPLASK
jgi:hypothetical protein